METSQFSRSEMLLGSGSSAILSEKSIIIFGLGGVGSYVAEAAARAGIGNITLVDSDAVSISNLNRQLCALHSTVGIPKIDVVASRTADINPDCRITKINRFVLPEDLKDFDFKSYDYIADAIDTISTKIELAVIAQETGTPIISCMGTGNKLDPSLFTVSDIYKTSVCPLCRVMRYELKKRNVKHLNVVWSPENPIDIKAVLCDAENANVPGSVSFVPGVAGLIMAGKIINDLSR